VVGFALNLIHLIACLIAPYMPETASSINSQLRADPIQIPDVWDANTIEPGHEIGKGAYLFSNIKPEKGREWREMFGSDEVKKVKDEEAARKASKKATKKAGKAVSKNAGE